MICYLPAPHDFHHYTPGFMQRFVGARRPRHGPGRALGRGGVFAALFLASRAATWAWSTIGEARPGMPLFWPNHPFNQAIAKIGEKFGGSDALIVFVEGDRNEREPDGEVLQRMEAMQRYMRKYVDPGATSSLVDIIKSYWLVNHYNDPKWGFVPDAAQSIGGIVFQLQRSNIPGFLRPYLTDDAEDANITFVFRDHKGVTIKRAMHYAQQFINENPMGRINVRLVEDQGPFLNAAHYLLGPVLFPKHAEMAVQVADINEDQKVTGYQSKQPVQIGKWSTPSDPAAVEKDVVDAIRALASKKQLGEIARSTRLRQDLELDDERLGKIADKLSAEQDYRIETIDRPADEVVTQFASVGELVDYVVARSNYYVVAEWKNDEGNITAQTLRYCRTYCNYELWTQNTKFKDASFNPQRTNTYTRGAEFVLAGGIMGVYAAVNEEVERGHVANILLIFFICYLFVAVSYRSNAAGLIIVFSLACATIGSLAYMAWRQTGLTIQTLPVQSVGVGVGVDYAFYIIDRIRQEYSWCHDIDEAIRRAIRTTGMAVTFTATTLVAGIIPWSISNLRFQAEMAQLLSILMFVNMLGAIYLVPAWFSIVRPRFVISSLTESPQQHEMRLAVLPRAAAGSAR